MCENNTSRSEGFFESQADLDEIQTAVLASEVGSDDIVPPEETPALRDLGRPPSWRAARSPATLLGPQYASAARRAREILRRSRP